jgi:hypothetical protein
MISSEGEGVSVAAEGADVSGAEIGSAVAADSFSTAAGVFRARGLCATRRAEREGAGFCTGISEGEVSGARTDSEAVSGSGSETGVSITGGGAASDEAAVLREREERDEEGRRLAGAEAGSAAESARGASSAGGTAPLLATSTGDSSFIITYFS